MSTENNPEQLYNNSVQILTDLIAFKTISGEDNSPLIDYCDNILKKLGASSFRTFDDEKKRVNLFATLKAKNSNNKKPIILSGHTDVVPVSKGWSSDPFTATIKDNKLYGRGSCDMKGFIACTLAYAPIYSKSNLDRDIHFSFTFDEETACQGAPILIEELKKREIKDGMRYVLDEDGNVAKDSLGNDIKEDNFIIISALLMESKQFKSAVVEARADFYNSITRQKMRSVKVGSESNFVHFSTRLLAGDKRAVSQETRRRLGIGLIAFPSNEMLLMNSAADIRGNLLRAIRENKSLL